MTKASDLCKRLNAVEVAMSGTLTAKLAKLTDEQRMQYRRWRTACDQWHAQFADPGDAYASFINDGDSGPTLRCDVDIALFGLPITISADATEVEAAEIYRRYVVTPEA